MAANIPFFLAARAGPNIGGEKTESAVGSRFLSGSNFHGEPLAIAMAELGRGARQAAPFVEVDAVLYPHMEAVRRLVASGALVAAVNEYVDDDWRI